MGYMFRLLLSLLQALKEIQIQLPRKLNALWDPQYLQNKIIIVTTWNHI